jgi:hypothetical protein
MVPPGALRRKSWAKVRVGPVWRQVPPAKVSMLAGPFSGSRVKEARRPAGPRVMELEALMPTAALLEIVTVALLTFRAAGPPPEGPTSRPAAVREALARLRMAGVNPLPWRTSGPGAELVPPLRLSVPLRKLRRFQLGRFSAPAVSVPPFRLTMLLELKILTAPAAGRTSVPPDKLRVPVPLVPELSPPR